MKRVFAHIGFSSAITLVVACLISTKFVILFSVGLAVLFIASLSLSYFRRNVTLPICFGSALLASVIFLATMNGVVAPQLALDDTEADISFYIIDKEQKVDDYEYVYTTRASLNGGKFVKMRVKSSSPIGADYYTYVNGKATLYKIGDSAFSSYGYWADNIYLTAVLDDDYVVTNDKKSSIMPLILHFRDKVTNALLTYIGGDAGGVAVALVTGDKSYVDPVVKNYFRLSGSSHIMAVSGLHLSVVAGLVLWLLRRHRVADGVTIPIVVSIILFYIALVGFSPSVVRAGVMMIVLVVAPLFKTSSDTLNSLGVAVFMLCLNPFAVSDIGAVLSAVSALSLILSANASYKRYIGTVDMDTPLNKRMSSRVTNRMFTLYATLYVVVLSLPVMYIFFGSASVSTYVANFAVVPLGSICVVLSVFTALFGIVNIGFVAKALAFLTRHLISFVVSIVKFLASFNGSTVRLDKSFGLILAGALVIIAVCFIFNNSVLLRKGIAIALAFIVISVGTIYFMSANYSYIYVTEDGAVVIQHNDKTVVANVSTYSDVYAINAYLTSRHDYIDLLVLDGNNLASTTLTQNVVTNMVLTNELSEVVLDTACYKDIELKNKYTVDFGDGFVLDYYYNDYKVKIDNFDVIVTSKTYPKSDIVINKKTNIITDANGKIDLANGDVLYTINDNNYFARRMV